MSPAPVAARAGDTRWVASSYQPDEDPGHLLPADVWATVQAAAQAVPAGHGRAVPDRTVTAYAHGGVMAGGPRLGVIHSAETPLAAGYAYSIARNWFGTAKAGTSATVMIDPTETIRLLPDNVVAYHVGPKGNGFSVGVEQAGYANFSRVQWLTTAGQQQLRRVAQYMRECRDRWGIPLRWATDAQIRAAAVPGGPAAGWCFHDDVRRVLGGTTHTDPMPNYPKTDLMALAIAGEDEDMPSLDEIANAVWGYNINGANARDRLQGVDEKTQDLPMKVWGFQTSGQGVQAQDRLTGIDGLVQAVRGQLLQLVATADVDEAQVAAALAPAILAGLREQGAGGVTVAQVEAAVRRVFADAAA